ncbi:MAG TPA: hypothetical protein PKX17_02640 [Candidatus Methanomethylicus sp.]|nr:hypothetical protein [Candidatus Methanomethylicus sp.]
MSTLEKISDAILSGDAAAAAGATLGAVESGASPYDIIRSGVLKAWANFCIWYERDEKESLKAWLGCFNATLKVLKILDERLAAPPPPYSVLVATALGEGHVLMKAIISTMLRAKGLKVYSSLRGLRPEDADAALSDPMLRFVVLSCIESGIQGPSRDLIKHVKEKRKDVVTIAGGPAAKDCGADIVTSDLEELDRIVNCPKVRGD